MYCVIYDGNCNLCANLVQVLERVDRGQQFRYVPMQDEAALARYGITAADCEAGMIVLDQTNPRRRWQGSEAAEEIGRLLPVVKGLVEVYRAVPGVKGGGDRLYAYIRDHRYQLFGQRRAVYQPTYPLCDSGTCDRALG